MKVSLWGTLLFLTLAAGCLQPVSQDSLTVQSFFCPLDPCESALENELNDAQSFVHVAMYSFTLPSAADALIMLKQKGLDVRVVVEEQQINVQKSEVRRLAENGIEVRVDSNPDLLHHKFAVIDGKTVLSGSMNWTRNGVKGNSENFMVIHSVEEAQAFEEEWQYLWLNAKPLNVE